MVLSCEKDLQTPGFPITPSCGDVWGCFLGRGMRIGPANRDGLDCRYSKDWSWIRHLCQENWITGHLSGKDFIFAANWWVNDFILV